MKILKHVCYLFLFSVGLDGRPAVADNPPPAAEDWTKASAKKVGNEMIYVGSSADESSESEALQAAERDALAQLIRHYFGVKLHYSLAANESLREVQLSMEAKEKSENLNIQGLVRLNTKVTEPRWRRYSAWVQVAVPISALKAEKARLERERRDAARERARVEELRRKQKTEKSQQSRSPSSSRKKGMVPLIYLGMSRDAFTAYYPAPDSISRYGSFEIFSYSGKWNFCTNSLMGCRITFQNGRLSEWNNFNHTFINPGPSGT